MSKVSNHNAETPDYTPPKKTAYQGTPKASYTPGGPKPDEHSYGKDGGKANILAGVPSVVVGGSSEVGVVPAMPGTLKIGEDKNVSTPVSG